MTPHYTTSDHALIERLTEEGLTAAEIGERLGRTSVAIDQFRSRNGIMVQGRACQVCGKPQYAKRLCVAHYSKRRRMAA